jgi:hypothetical protein
MQNTHTHIHTHTHTHTHTHNWHNKFAETTNTHTHATTTQTRINPILKYPGFLCVFLPTWANTYRGSATIGIGTTEHWSSSQRRASSHQYAEEHLLLLIIMGIGDNSAAGWPSVNSRNTLSFRTHNSTNKHNIWNNIRVSSHLVMFPPTWNLCCMFSKVYVLLHFYNLYDSGYLSCQMMWCQHQQNKLTLWPFLLTIVDWPAL